MYIVYIYTVARTQGIEIVRLMEEETKREEDWAIQRAQASWRRGRARKRKGNGEVGGRTLFRSFIRGRVQILNRILDECISLTRLRPVGIYTRGQGLRLRWKLEKGGYDDDGYEQEGGKGR